MALFFIDDISSYRPTVEGKKPYLLQAFEKLLKEKIESMLDELDEHETEYRAYLEASLADISACHAGYFSQDNSDTDENIAREVEIILHGKKQLLSFKNNDGSYNTLRFLFSKWTLKEGWDNPNVFTITKLRSSGSENSKLQEVGRGLRLPVDEKGNRVANEEFTLNYIVDFTEADFARQLVDQINGEIPQAMSISKEKLEQVAAKLNISADKLFGELYGKHYIGWQMNINVETRDAFFAEYPDFAAGLATGKVIDRNVKKSKVVKLRKDVYDKLRHLWEAINQRCLLLYDDKLDYELDNVVLSLLNKEEVFTEHSMTSLRDVVKSEGSRMTLVAGQGAQYKVSRPIPYGEFLKRINQANNIPVQVLHKAMCEYVKKNGEIKAEHINENTVSMLIQQFNDWKINHLQGRFRYEKINIPVGETALSYADGSPRDEIAQGRIGTKIAQGTPGDKYLYDAIAYDSALELKNIMSDIEEVIAFGKIPRGSIAIPTITGGMYSPDFMYLVKNASGQMELNLVVETKGVENKSELRQTEQVKIECARLFFEMLSNEGFTVYFRDQLNNRQMVQIILEILKE